MSSRSPESATVPGPDAEWLEADGLGGFASSTVQGVRTRRYHALLLSAVSPPSDRFVLVNGFDAVVRTPAGSFALTSQRYAPDVLHPDGAGRIVSFESEPWPRWIFVLEDGTRLEQEIVAIHGTGVVMLTFRLAAPQGGALLEVRPFLSGRDDHALQRENTAFRFGTEARGGRIVWRPYPGVPGIIALTNGVYEHAPDWYRNFLYREEKARGLDCIEDLAAPGLLRFDLSRREAVILLGAEGQADGVLAAEGEAEETARGLRAGERRRRARFPTRLDRAGDAYLVRRGEGKTIIAGYPWFADWGRDTFIALRGLCLATGRLQEAREILIAWSGLVSEGMIPNRLQDRGSTPEYNAVDASLWFVLAAHEYLEAMRTRRQRAPSSDAARLRDAIEAILDGYTRGTRYGIRADEDGLLLAGVPGVQLTWMDAKVGDWIVTPRIGKPVEVQALWLNALALAAPGAPRFATLHERGRRSFAERFWNAQGGFLYDVVDPDGRAGSADASFRPNQIFAVGGLPRPLLEGERARRVVDAVEARLLTPLGLRSLAPGEPGYAPRYEGGVRERDGAFHQGTVWPWLMGPFVEAWVRVRGGTAAARREARTRFLEPLLARLGTAGLGHLPEIADAEPPHTPRGCPFQAWSVGEALRLDRVVLAFAETPAPGLHSSSAQGPGVPEGRGSS
jgi:predicted glycogen debranching enzyme